jgi:nicotinamide-nucleotide amidase
MQAEIITIGDEILIGQTVDTNSAWMGQNLNEVGVDVHRILTVRDTREEILYALNSMDAQTRLVLITGGLGPTRDDVTKQTLCEFFDTEMEFRDDIFDHIHQLFTQMGRDISQLNKEQAWFPQSAEGLQNGVGTAWGMKFQKEGRFYISMPGVPYEMKYLMREHVLPWINQDLMDQDILHRTLLTQGIPESVLAHRLTEWEDALPPEVKLAYLPSPGIVKLRLTAKGDGKILRPLIDGEAHKLRELLGADIYGEGKDTLQELIGSLLVERNLTLGTAESCTGGYIAHLLTSVAGSSRYFQGSIVSYSNEIKERELGVQHQTLVDNGAVSEAVVREMAEGGKAKLGVDVCVAVSGIAGPDGGTEEKPVGTVWIAVSSPAGTHARKFQFSKDRQRNIRRSALMAMDMLRRQLLRVEPVVS